MYTCELCGKEFKQKNDWLRHCKKKNACIKPEQVKELKDVIVSNGNDIYAFFKSCLDVFYRDGIVGQDALKNLTYFLFLKTAKRHYKTHIDIYNKKCYNFGNSQKDKYAMYLIDNKLIELENMQKSKDDDIFQHYQIMWEKILSQHPITKKIFIENDFFGFNKISMFRKLLDKLSEFDTDKYDIDIIGDAYQSVIHQIYQVNKGLGQHFTNRKICNMMIKKIDPKIIDGKVETIFDPAMGSGGFLISSGYPFKNIEHKDSIHEPIGKNLYDIVLTNPPFGTKGFSYMEIQNSNLKIPRHDYVPIKIADGTSIFLQLVISILKIRGRCGIVYPNGKQLYGGGGFKDIREYLLKTCKVSEIYYLPSGIFEHTGIKTVVMFLTKKKDVKDVIEVKTTQKTHNIKFIGKIKTKEIKFFDYDPNTDKSTELGIVSMKQLEENGLSFNYDDYKEDDKLPNFKECEMKKLEDICEVYSGEFLPKKNMSNGIYNVIGGGKIIGTHNKSNRDGNEIVITRVGDFNIKWIDSKYYLTDNAFAIKSKLESKYLYYYLLANNNTIINQYKGVAQQVISKTNLLNIKIPIPKLTIQKQIADKLDFIYNEAIETSKKKIEELKKINKIYVETHTLLNVEMKKLGDITTIEYGTRIVKKDSERGDYYVYGGGDKTFTTNSYNRDGINVVVSRFALSKECVRILEGKFYLNDSGFTIKTNNTKYLIDGYLRQYIYNIMEIIYNYSRGTAQRNLDMDKIRNLKISIPNLTIQKQIADFCEKNDKLIKQLEEGIEEYKQLAKNIFETFLSIQENRYS